jgi:hypothetical protein
LFGHLWVSAEQTVILPETGCKPAMPGRWR